MYSQFIHPESTNIICFKLKKEDKFSFYPSSEIKALEDVKMMEEIPEISKGFNGNVKYDFNRGSIVNHSTYGFCRVPHPVNTTLNLGKVCLPSETEVIYNLKEFEQEKLYALRIREKLTECINNNIIPNLDIRENIDTTDLNNVSTNKIVCTKDEVDSIKYILKHKITYPMTDIWLEEDLNRLNILVGEIPLKDREEKTFVEPYIYLKEDIEKPIVFSKGSKATYLVQATVNLDIALINCSYWNEKEVNLGYKNDDIHIDEKIMKISSIKVFKDPNEGIKLKLKSFVVVREHLDKMIGIDVFSFYLLP
jgi:hypothetical protein